jgi:hypothetical protein
MDPSMGAWAQAGILSMAETVRLAAQGRIIEA